MIIRVFPRRTSFTPTDDYAFVGNPPLDRPFADEVHISTTFTWDKPRAEYLAKAWGQYYPVKVGGPAYDAKPNGFMLGMYVKEGVTFTSYGCNNRCPFCLVPKREGCLQIRDTFAPGYIIQDNNFAQCPRDHRLKVYRMLDKEAKAAVFSGGIEARLVTKELATEFANIRIHSVFLACDRDQQIEDMRRAADLLGFLGRNKLFCYTLIGFKGVSFVDLLHDRRRLDEVWKAGCMPFSQLYQPPEKLISYSREWRRFARTWSRPAAMKAAAVTRRG